MVQLLVSLKKAFVEGEKNTPGDYFLALKVLCYTTWGLVPVCLLGGGLLWEFGLSFPILQFSALAIIAITITFFVFLLSFRLKEKAIIKPLLWIYVSFVTVVETLVIYYSGGIVSPAHWLYFITISELIILLSPVKGIIVATINFFLFLGIVVLEMKGILFFTSPSLTPIALTIVHSQNVGNIVSMLSLYAMCAILVSIIIFRLNRKRKDLEATNLLLEEKTVQMKSLLATSENRQEELTIKNKELTIAKESLFKLMQNIEEVNRRLRNQGNELGSRKNELEALNEEMLSKQKELMNTTAELEKANMDLQELDRLKSEFISTVSHEIRTPLTSIREGVALISEKALGSLNKKQEKFLSIVEKNVLRLNILIHDILDLSQLESDQMNLSRQALNLPVLITETVESMQTIALKKKIRIETSFAKNLPKVYADEHRITQVLFNLIANAMKFTQENGIIAVGVYQQSPKGPVHVSVVDTGVGISKEELAEIFNKFYQIKRQTGPGYQGAGLGLPICQKIIQLHEGEVWVESELGQGSKFTFSLPVFSTERYIEDIFQSMAEKAEVQEKNVSFVLFKILGFGFLKIENTKKQVNQLFDQFTELVVGMADSQSHVVTNPEQGFVLIFKNAVKEELDGEIRDVEKILKNASFFLGRQEYVLRYHIVKASYPEDGDSKEKLLQFLGIEKEALSRFQP